MKKLSGIEESKALILILLSVLFLTGCHKHVTGLLKDIIDSISVTRVPDLREGIFNAELISTGRSLILKGETDNSVAKEDLTGILQNKGVIFIDSIKVLPDTTKVKKPWGLVNVSVCNIRSDPSFDAEMVNQALMGTPVKILKDENGWYFIQTPDFYLGWVDNEAIEVKSFDEFGKWKKSARIFYIKKTGDIMDDPVSGKPISDIVAGSIVELVHDQKGFSEVRLPDGRTGFIPKNDGFPLDQLTTGKYLTSGNLVRTAESFMGIPYLWGGTSAKGFDCSGFVKTVYFLNGIVLSRDASQQFRYGLRIRRAFYPDSLKAGDLLFFGSSRFGRPRPTHVAMYIANNEFIHASGMVKINSLDSTRSNFSRFRRDSFLGIRRIIGAETGKGIEQVSEHSWYK